MQTWWQFLIWLCEWRLAHFYWGQTFDSAAVTVKSSTFFLIKKTHTKTVAENRHTVSTRNMQHFLFFFLYLVGGKNQHRGVNYYSKYVTLFLLFFFSFSSSSSLSLSLSLSLFLSLFCFVFLFFVRENQHTRELISAWNMQHMITNEDIPLMEFMYLVFTRMPGESYQRWLRSFLYWYYIIVSALAWRLSSAN